MKTLQRNGWGSWAVHFILAGSWVLGLPTMIFSIGLAISSDAYVVATILFSCATVQFVRPPKPWPAFGQLLKDLRPRSYYSFCDFQLPKSAIRTSKTMLCYHPHGILACGFSWNGVLRPVHATEMLQYELTYLVASAIFWLPIFSVICYWLGDVKDASPANVRNIMQQGKNIALLPGGFEDATVMVNGQERIFLRNRKGFIKFALRYGYRVHPVYTFGEADTYNTCDWFLKARLWLNSFKIPGVIAWGEPLIPIFPRRDARLLTVFGEPIEMPLIFEPTATDIDLWHGKYITELVALFDKHKSSAGIGGRKLEIL